MLGVITHLVIILGLVIGTTTDFKRREVPDWLNFSLIGIGLGLGLLGSALLWSATPFVNSILGLIVGIVIGYVMFYAGQWGGGDAKLIMGLGALLGLDLSAGMQPTALPVLLLFIINIVLVGAIYGLLWALFIALKNWKHLKQELKEKLRERHIMQYRILVLSLTALLIALAFLTHSMLLTFTFAILAFILFFVFYLWIITKAVERTCMVKDLSTGKLTEGDWIYKDVWVTAPYRPFKDHLQEEATRKLAEKLRYDPLLSLYQQIGLERQAAARERTLKTRTEKQAQARLERCVERFVKETGCGQKPLLHALEGKKLALYAFAKKHDLLFAFLREHYQYAPDEQRICGPGDLGITTEQIAELERRAVRTVTVKEGIPFVPSFLLAYLVTMLLGNWLLLLF